MDGSTQEGSEAPPDWSRPGLPLPGFSCCYQCPHGLAAKPRRPSTSSTDTPGPSHQAVLGVFAEASWGADFLHSLGDPDGEYRQRQLRAQLTLARSRALPPFDFESAARWREQQFELALGQAT